MIFQRLRKWLRALGNPSGVGVLPDHVWISSRAKLDGIRRELDERSANGAALIALVAHFPDVLVELERIAAEYSGSASVRAVLAGELSTEAAAGLPLAESDVMALVVAERHPLTSVDDELLQFAEALPCRCRIVHHLSLDDPLLRFFGAQSLRTLLDRLGPAFDRLEMTEDEPITHGLVTRSIRRAQHEIEAQSTGRFDADSAAAWLEKNTR